MLSIGYNFWSEWELQEKVDFDGVNKTIRVYPHVTNLDIRADVWSAGVRWLGMLNRGYDRFLEPLERTGLDAIPGGQTGDFYFLTNGWKLQIDFSKTAVTGVLFSRDFDTAYYTFDGVAQFAAQVSSVVNTVTSVQNVVTGDISSVPTAIQNATAVWDDSNATTLQSNVSKIYERVRLVDKSIHVDTEQVANGDGSQENPFNNLNDTLTYAESLGLKIIHVLADITIDRNLKNFVVTGIGTPAIDCNGHDLDKSEFNHCVMKGDYTGSITVQQSVLFNGFRLNGFFENSVLAGDLFCKNNSSVLLKNCASFIQGSTQPSVSMSVSGICELGVRNYSGGFELRDMNNAADKCSIEPVAGAITLSSSCTGTGSLSLKGTADLVNNSTLTNISDKLIKSEDIGFIKDIESGRWDLVNDQMIFYASDNTTEIARFNMFDKSGVPTTDGNIYKRTRV